MNSSHELLGLLGLLGTARSSTQLRSGKSRLCHRVLGDLAAQGVLPVQAVQRD